jgi:hypothetical protein
VFHQQDAGPEEVNAAVIAGDFLDGFLEAGDNTAFDTEDLKELVPKGLFFGALTFDAGPFAGKLDRVVPDFVLGNWHFGDVYGIGHELRDYLAERITEFDFWLGEQKSLAFGN